MRRSLVLLVLLTAAGCARTRLAPQAQHVRVSLNQDDAKGCRLVGNVEGSTRRYLWFPGKSAAQESVTRQLRNDAASMRANVVVVRSSTTSMTQSSSRGEAYACG